jgi:hypothetical protein
MLPEKGEIDGAPDGTCDAAGGDLPFAVMVRYARHNTVLVIC